MWHMQNHERAGNGPRTPSAEVSRADLKTAEYSEERAKIELQKLSTQFEQLQNQIAKEQETLDRLPVEIQELGASLAVGNDKMIEKGNQGGMPEMLRQLGIAEGRRITSEIAQRSAELQRITENMPQLLAQRKDLAERIMSLSKSREDLDN